MSDSEEEFASADEGDTPSQEGATASSKEVKETKKSEEPGTTGKQNKKKGKGLKGGEPKSVNKSTENNQQSKKQEAVGSKNKKNNGKKKGKQQASVETENVNKDLPNEPVSKADEKGDSAIAKGGEVVADGNVSKEKVDGTNVSSEISAATTEKSETVKEDNIGSQSDDSSKVNEKVTTPVKDSSPAGDSVQSDTRSIGQKADLIKSPSSQSISRPEPDHTEKQEEVLGKLAEAATEKKSGWGWGWGSSLLEVASTSVNTFTSHVGEGFHTVMETVESTLNVPSPEEMANMRSQETEKQQQEKQEDDKDGSPSEAADKEEKQEPKAPAEAGASAESQAGAGDQSSKPSQSDSWFSSWGVSNITKMVESTGKNLVTGSLDVLETLGKKTFDAINEHDPGLKKTRGFLINRGDKPNLSSTLRDAKERNEALMKQEKENEEARQAHFGSLFDEFQGLAHLEALEMLSNQSEKRVNTLLTALSPEVLGQLKPQLLEIKQVFETGEDEEDEDVEEHDFVALVTGLLSQMNIGTTPDKVNKTHQQIRDKLKDLESTEQCDASTPKDIHRVAIQSMAELTSKSIEQFHKSGEMILLKRSPDTDLPAVSKNLLSLTKTLSAEVGIISTKFTEVLNKYAEGDGTANVNTLVTNVYLEASNSSSYIQDGFRLLLPVMQQAAIENSQEPK